MAGYLARECNDNAGSDLGKTGLDGRANWDRRGRLIFKCAHVRITTDEPGAIVQIGRFEHVRGTSIDARRIELQAKVLAGRVYKKRVCRYVTDSIGQSRRNTAVIES